MRPLRLFILLAFALACVRQRSAPALATPVSPSDAALVSASPEPLPVPLPAPDEIANPESDAGSVPPPPDDLEEFLYAHRINFAAGGAPLVTVRLMEGQDGIALEGDQQLNLLLHGAQGGEHGKQVGVPPHQSLRIRLRESSPAALRDFPQVADLKLDDREGLKAARALWEGRGYEVQQRTVGTVYGVAGRVLDNRRILLLLGQGSDAEGAQTLLSQVRRDFGSEGSEAGQVFEELIRRPAGILEVQDETGATVAASNDLVAIDSAGEVLVRRVEYGVGYAFHGYQDRRYRGRLFAAVDKLGKLALVEALPLEELLRGLVPSEMFATAPPEALRAQAVTARGEVLAKIGARHLTDPYVLCAEQHCQVYGGLGSERTTTDAAVKATRGEALFGPHGRLVDSVYSAVCGGHTEDNDVVWGGPPDPTLRGVSDLAEGASGNLREEVQLRRWIERVPESYCRLSGSAPPTKVRWTKRFTAAELDALLAPLGVGHVSRLVPQSRGSSGRAAVLRVIGDQGEAEVHGELRIRKLLKNMNSSAFVVDVEPDERGRPAAFVFRGAGWGHGVGMCQTGAIGRANRGHDYRQILRHYFNGSEITRIY